jgi:hypothetical protein
LQANLACRYDKYVCGLASQRQVFEELILQGKIFAWRQNTTDDANDNTNNLFFELSTSQ